MCIPTASNDDEASYKMFQEVYGDTLGCETDVLYLLDESIEQKDIAQKIAWADLIYVGAGNSLMMMRKWRFLKVDRLLKQAAAKGTVLAGVSAGALCWFEYGHSDAMSYYKQKEVQVQEENWDFIRVKCLGLVDRLMLCPHYDQKNRQISFQSMLQRMGGVGLGLEDYCAIQIVGDNYRIVQAKKEAKAHKVFKIRAKTLHENINPSEKWTPISVLRRRPASA